jgi:hypothetical protein
MLAKGERSMSKFLFTTEEWVAVEARADVHTQQPFMLFTTEEWERRVRRTSEGSQRGCLDILDMSAHRHPLTSTRK